MVTKSKRKNKTRWSKPIPLDKLAPIIDTFQWWKEVARGGPTWKGRKMLHPYEIEKRLELALMAEYVTPMEMRKEIAKLEWQLECCLWMRVEEEMFDPEGTGERAPEEQWKEWMEETWSRVCRACNICRECDICELMWIPRFFQFTGFWESNSGRWDDKLDDDDDDWATH